AYPVGQDPITISFGDGVMANDSNGYFAVLKTQTGGGMITSFGFDGSFTFVPNDSFYQTASINFQYTLFALNGWYEAGDVTLYPPNMDISNGQRGLFIKPENRLKPGAFTVANLNDTNGDGTVDALGAPITVGANSPRGSSDEVDLMQLRV